MLLLVTCQSRLGEMRLSSSISSGASSYRLRLGNSLNIVAQVPCLWDEFLLVLRCDLRSLVSNFSGLERLIPQPGYQPLSEIRELALFLASFIPICKHVISSMHSFLCFIESPIVSSYVRLFRRMVRLKILKSCQLICELFPLFQPNCFNYLI